MKVIPIHQHTRMSKQLMLMMGRRRFAWIFMSLISYYLKRGVAATAAGITASASLHDLVEHDTYKHERTLQHYRINACNSDSEPDDSLFTFTHTCYYISFTFVAFNFRGEVDKLVDEQMPGVDSVQLTRFYVTEKQIKDLPMNEVWYSIMFSL
jgi:hypothetical protein